jgi:phenylacetate-CoA ligase
MIEANRMDLYGRLLQRVLFPAWEELRGRPTVELTEYVGLTQWWTLDELRALQSGFLRRLVRHAYAHTAFYRERFDAAGVSPEDIRSPADLIKLPLLERAEARGASTAREATAPPFAAVRKQTSGSTGEPMVIAYNAESRHWRDAARWRGYGWAGYQPGMRALHYWGVGATPPKSRFARAKVEVDHFLRRDFYVDCTPRSDDHLAQVVEHIRSYDPQVIVTYTQAGAALARYVNRTGSRTWGTIPVLCGAERLWPHDRAVLEEAFGPAVFETYGSREFMLMGSECDQHDGLHTSMENLILELVVREPDGTTRPAQPGEVGEVVCTDLHNLYAPLIRYATSDLATARADEQCACGRWLPRIGPIEGRVTETLRDAAGNPVSGLIFSILFVSLAEHCKQFQAVQHLDGSLTLRLVPIEGASDFPPVLHQLAQGFAAKYLPGIAMTIEKVEDIPPTRAGKRQIVVVEKPS